MEIENFCKLTGYNVSPAEFVYIKESYEESGISNSTDFCAQWLIDRANGFWKKEMKLREKLANAKQELADATADKVIAENKLAEQTEQMNKYKDEVTKLTDATNRAAETIQSLLDTKNRLTAELESAKADAVKATESENEIREQLLNLNAEKEELGKKLSEALSKADERNAIFDSLKADYVALTEQYDALKQRNEDRINTAEVDELKQELTVAKTELDTVKAEIVNQQYTIEDYKSLLFSINKLSKI